MLSVCNYLHIWKKKKCMSNAVFNIISVILRRPVNLSLSYFYQYSTKYYLKAFNNGPTYESMGTCRRGMNPVAMTIINIRKQFWPSRGLNHQLPVLEFLYATDRAIWTRRKGLVTRRESLIYFLFSSKAYTAAFVLTYLQHLPCFEHTAVAFCCSGKRPHVES